MKHTTRCCFCGRFVSNSDLHNGLADLRCSPDFSWESIEVFHMYCRAKQEVRCQTSTNTDSPKLPTVEECICEVRRRMLGSEYSEGIPAMVTILHDFICRQLRASA